MRGLSLYQPHATLMAIGAKTVETRSRRTSYRGLVAIHATKESPEAFLRLCGQEPFYRRVVQAMSPGGTPLGPEHWRTHAERLPRGAILAVGELRLARRIWTLPDNRAQLEGPGSDCRYIEGEEYAFGDYSPGRWGWDIVRVRRLPEPIPYRGAQGLWPVDAHLAAQLEAWWRQRTPLKAAS